MVEFEMFTFESRVQFIENGTIGLGTIGTEM
jgi:hypothetical protein